MENFLEVVHYTEFDRLMEHVSGKVGQECVEIIALVNADYLHIVEDRKYDKRYLKASDLKVIVSHIQNYYSNRLGFVPTEINDCCNAVMSSFLGGDRAFRPEKLRFLCGLLLGILGVCGTVEGVEITYKWYSTGLWDFMKTCVNTQSIDKFFVPTGCVVIGTVSIVYAYVMCCDVSGNFKRSDDVLRMLKETLMATILRRT